MEQCLRCTDLHKAQETLNRERQVFLASTSRQAFSLARDLGFSVVLVELNFNGKHGAALIRSMREKLPGLPIIAITDTPQKAAHDLLEELGVAEVLSKPITPAWKPVVERVRAMRAR